MPKGRHLLNAWRERSKLTQTELAEALKVSNGYMSQILTGKRTPTNLPFLMRIEALTGVPPSSWVDTKRGKSEKSQKPSANAANVH